MGRLLFGILPFVFSRIWKRLLIAGGILVALAVVMRVTGIAPGKYGAFSGPYTWIVLRLLLGLMALCIAAVLTAPFRVGNDQLVPWALHREVGTPPPLKEDQEAARQKIRNASKDMPKGGAWALGVRIVYTKSGQIVWIPTQVLYGALGTALGMFLLANILGTSAAPAMEILDELYTLPVILVGGAAGLIGGSIGRSFVEALSLGLMSFAFTLAAAIWSSVKLQPWLKNVLPPMLLAQFWTLIAARLFLPRLRRLGRMFHYGLVGYVAPAAVVAGIFYLASSHVSGLKRQIGENETRVSWIWSTPDGKLLMAGRNELYGDHWLYQRKILGGIWSIDPKRKRIEPLTSDLAILPFMQWDLKWYLKQVPRLDWIALPLEPTEIGRLLESRGSLSLLHSNGRIEAQPQLPPGGPLRQVVYESFLAGVRYDQNDIDLISSNIGDSRASLRVTPFPQKSAILITGSKQVLFDLKKDRAWEIKEHLDRPSFMIDGPRGREIIAEESEDGDGNSSRLAVYNLEQGTLTRLTEYHQKLSLDGATNALILIHYRGQSRDDWHYGVVSLDREGEFKEFAWPEETVVHTAITPAGQIHVWTNKNLKILEPSSWEEKNIPRPQGMRKGRIGLKGYQGQDPILLIKTDSLNGELKRLDLNSGKLSTLVAGVFR